MFVSCIVCVFMLVRERACVHHLPSARCICWIFIENVYWLSGRYTIWYNIVASIKRRREGKYACDQLTSKVVLRISDGRLRGMAFSQKVWQHSNHCTVMALVSVQVEWGSTTRVEWLVTHQRKRVPETNVELKCTHTHRRRIESNMLIKPFNRIELIKTKVVWNGKRMLFYHISPPVCIVCVYPSKTQPERKKKKKTKQNTNPSKQKREKKGTEREEKKRRKA